MSAIDPNAPRLNPDQITYLGRVMDRLPHRLVAVVGSAAFAATPVITDAMNTQWTVAREHNLTPWLLRGDGTPPHLAAPGVLAPEARCEMIARANDWPVNVLDAAWFGPCAPDCDHGPRVKFTGYTSVCPTAGARRNHAMLDLHPDVLVAFLDLGPTRFGPWEVLDAAAYARTLGIPVRLYKINEP